MRFLNFFFTWSRPVDPLPRREIERAIRDHDQKLKELQDAVNALRTDHDPSSLGSPERRRGARDGSGQGQQNDA
jgi:hypothetical protein